MILVRLEGGLGNQMFQYALGRTLALKNKSIVKVDTTFLLDRTPRGGFVFRNYDLDIFKTNILIAERKEIPLLYRKYFNGRPALFADSFRKKIVKNPGKEKQFQFDPEILKLSDGTYLEGYWQSPKYFEAYADIIKKDFEIREKLPKNAEALRDKIMSLSSVCINVRRADFVSNPFHGTLGQEYFDKGIEIIARKEKQLSLFVFSDDIEWCKNNLKFKYPYEFIGHEYAGDKFQFYLELMKSCGHFIIPNSSFGWWAAWLSPSLNKVIIAPQRWFLDDRVNTKDLTPTSWIRI